MSRYQKRPVVIEAWQTDMQADRLGLPFEINMLPMFDGETWSIWDKLHDTHIKFEPGDWIIRGLKGELYPCKPDVFESSYEPAVE